MFAIRILLEFKITIAKFQKYHKKLCLICTYIYIIFLLDTFCLGFSETHVRSNSITSKIFLVSVSTIIIHNTDFTILKYIIVLILRKLLLDVVLTT